MCGWRDEGSDIVVDMSPKRSGGDRYYRTKLGVQCTEMGSMHHLRLESGIGGNVICGNAGDRMMFFLTACGDMDYSIIVVNEEMFGLCTSSCDWLTRTFFPAMT